MFSLIICSRKARLSQVQEKNIAETIGCEYELVVIDNSKNQYSIFSAYNEGVRRAKGDILCFMHDDILYKTSNWGPMVASVLKNEEVGIVGVIGSYCLIADYGYWDMMTPYVTGYMICVSKLGVQGNSNCNKYYDQNSSNEIVAADGFWLCARKDLFKRISFDENTYSGFHFYDMDICMQSIMAGYKNMVLRDVLIQHNASPQYVDQFFYNMKKFHEKWRNNLPVYRGVLEKLDASNERLLRESAYNKMMCKHYQYSYYSVLESKAFKIGNIILKPIRLFKKR